jgi:hypothetical protein
VVAGVAMQRMVPVDDRGKVTVAVSCVFEIHTKGGISCCSSSAAQTPRRMQLVQG